MLNYVLMLDVFNYKCSYKNFAYYFYFKVSDNECRYASIKLYIDILLDTCKNLIKFSYVN